MILLNDNTIFSYFSKRHVVLLFIPIKQKFVHVISNRSFSTKPNLWNIWADFLCILWGLKSLENNFQSLYAVMPVSQSSWMYVCLSKWNIHILAIFHFQFVLGIRFPVVIVYSSPKVIECTYNFYIDFWMKFCCKCWSLCELFDYLLC